MNLKPLFEMQQRLDQAIRIKRDISHVVDLKHLTIDALEVEIAELQNEVRYFKYWSANQKPTDKALEEYADGLHFFLSLGIAFNIPFDFEPYPYHYNDFRKTFRAIKRNILIMRDHRDWYLGFNLFLGLGQLLGFTDEMIEKAYKEKNEVNYKRLEDGY